MAIRILLAKPLLVVNLNNLNNLLLSNLNNLLLSNLNNLLLSKLNNLLLSNLNNLLLSNLNNFLLNNNLVRNSPSNLLLSSSLVLYLLQYSNKCNQLSLKTLANHLLRAFKHRPKCSHNLPILQTQAWICMVSWHTSLSYCISFTSF